jgi:hypothetical protein
MAQLPLIPSLQELRWKSAENRREGADLVRRSRLELREVRAATEAAITQSRLLMQEADALLYAPQKGWLRMLP